MDSQHSNVFKDQESTSTPHPSGLSADSWEGTETSSEVSEEHGVGWTPEQAEQSKLALDDALDLTARHAERMLREVGGVGMILIPLDARLQPLDGLQIALDHIPPTSGARRFRVEDLARNVLKAAAGYIALAEIWQAPAGRARKPSEHPEREEGVILQAETRARDCCTRLYAIIRRPGEPPTLALADQSRESAPGLFGGLLQVADAVTERSCLLDDRLLQTALAAHAETIHGLRHDDLLMFAVGANLVQVIGSEHTVRECTMLRLADIKAKATAGDERARRLYYELTAGRGVLQRVERGVDGRETVKMKFPSEPGWFAAMESGLNRVSVASDVMEEEK